jgi:hypothetical protein
MLILLAIVVEDYPHNYLCKKTGQLPKEYEKNPPELTEDL